MNENIILEKSIRFGVRMIKLAEFLQGKKQRVIADQILRSGTSIGANVAESDYAASKADFINKLKISEKEAGETAYWLHLLKAAETIDEKQFDSLFADVQELQRLIGSSLKTLKKNL
jgi:four helix bundle protein